MRGQGAQATNDILVSAESMSGVAGTLGVLMIKDMLLLAPGKSGESCGRNAVVLW